jgi:hypothetical protein
VIFITSTNGNDAEGRPSGRRGSPTDVAPVLHNNHRLLRRGASAAICAARQARRNGMLSGEALDLAFALRAQVGPLSQGEGPSATTLCEASGLPQSAFERALAELESVGFVAIDRSSADDTAVVVLAPLQIYLEDLESQGTDDL